MDATTDDATCDAVDAVIAYIDSTGIDYFVGPFETAIEGDYEKCMEILKNCQLVGAKAGLQAHDDLRQDQLPARRRRHVHGPQDRQVPPPATRSSPRKSVEAA